MRGSIYLNSYVAKENSKKSLLLVLGIALMVLLISSFGFMGNAAAQSNEPAPQKLVKPAELYKTLKDPKERLFFHALARPDGKDMVYHIKGKAYAYVPGDVFNKDLKHGQALFGVEGYNIRRAVQIKGTNDFKIMTREIVFYTDLKTGKILKEWKNPITGITYPISHIENDHVDFDYRVVDGGIRSVIKVGDREIGAFPIEKPERLGEQLVFHADAFPLYDLAERYNIQDPMNLKNGIYTSAEFFDFQVPAKYENKMKGNKTPKGILPITNSWTRVSPWTPWMGLDEAEYPGNLVFHARSEVLEGFDDLPEWIQEEVEEYYPLYESTGKQIDPTPNTTSWTSFYTNVLKPAAKTWRVWAGLN